ncbi:MAG: DUF4388 domain-containing protein [Thermoanaerobaculia bacterium]
MSDESPDPDATARDAHARLKGNLLVVDPDDLLVEMIESGFSLSRPGWQLVATRQPSEALDVLQRHSDFEAIITEIVFNHSSASGKDFVREVTRRWPDVPIFVMSSVGVGETQDLDTADYIAKPPDMDFLIRRIDRAIRKQRESRVRGISLATFLQILEIERKSCTVIVSNRGRVGQLYLRDGKLIQARLDAIEGEDALFGILSMREQSLRVIDKCEEKKTIATSLTALLMEWSVREDNAKRGGAASREENG